MLLSSKSKRVGSIATIFSSRDVEINQKPDSTIPGIRGNLRCLARPTNLGSGEKRKRSDEEGVETQKDKAASRKQLRDENHDAFQIVTVTLNMLFLAIDLDRPVTPRAFSRIAMETWGWPVKYFLHKLELLCTFENIIEGTYIYTVICCYHTLTKLCD